MEKSDREKEVCEPTVRTVSAWSVGDVILEDYDEAAAANGMMNATRIYGMANSELRMNFNYVKWYILIGSGFVMLFLPTLGMFFSCVSIRSGSTFEAQRFR